MAVMTPNIQPAHYTFVNMTFKVEFYSLIGRNI